MFDRDDRLVLSNTRFAEIYGLPDGILKPGVTLTETVAAMLAGGLLPGDGLVLDSRRQLSLVGGGEIGARTHELRNGRTITVTRQPKADGGWVATHSDVTELRRVEKQLSHLVNHDALTGLCNRRRFNEVLDEVMQDDVRRRNAAVMFLDLDRFKAVNDTLGHAAGDALLKTVAERLLACVRQHDIVCRLGGDEFAILQLHAAQPEGAESLAQRLTRSLSQPVAIGEELATIGVSTGIALAPRDGEDSRTLLHHADLAVYRAKDEGRNTYRFYEAGMGERLAAPAKLSA
jgi:diguanylate cyclase (GGDEF)-like protein